MPNQAPNKDVKMSNTQFYHETLASGAYNDFQRQYLFRVIFPGRDNEDILVTYFVTNTTTPQETTGTIVADWMNSQIKVGGRTTYAEWTVTVRDRISNDVYRYFNDWRKSVYDRSTGLSSKPGDYKQNITLDLIGETSQTNIEFTLKNAWPTTIGSATLDYSVEGFITFPVTFAFDSFITNKD